MSATVAQNCAVLTQSSRSASQNRTLLIRFGLAALAVGISLCFRWVFLRYLTSEANLRVDLLAGIHLQRVSSDSVMWKGILYRYENSCTFIDVWFGSIPLLWSLRRPHLHNISFLLTFALGMFCFNVMRLSVSDVLFAAGLSWNLAHNVISGISYYVVWVWIWKHLQKEEAR